jgi:hypothetical protein
VIFVGIDWSETQHDVCVVDAEGRVLGQERASGAAGYRREVLQVPPGSAGQEVPCYAEMTSFAIATAASTERVPDGPVTIMLTPSRSHSNAGGPVLPHTLDERGADLIDLNDGPGTLTSRCRVALIDQSLELLLRHHRRRLDQPEDPVGRMLVGVDHLASVHLEGLRVGDIDARRASKGGGFHGCELEKALHLRLVHRHGIGRGFVPRHGGSRGHVPHLFLGGCRDMSLRLGNR